MSAGYRLVLFDFDGTLADSFPWFARVLNDVADRYRFRRVAEHEIDLLRSLSGRQVMEHVGAPPWKVPFIAAHMRRLKARDIAEVPLFQGAASMLERLHDAGVTIAIVSSNSYENVRHVLGARNAALVHHFECGVSIFGKRRRFVRVLRRTGIAPDAALSVGDEIRDAEAARAAGIPFAAVSWGYTTPASLQRQSPAALFTSFDEITTFVTGAQSGRRQHR